jgi:phage host-nuclease inhibitor protein Gam
MKTKRIKSALTPLLESRDDAEACLNDLANAVNNLRQAQAIRDARVLEINEHYAPAFALLDQSIREYTTALQLWAEANPSDFPKGRKSLVMTSGTIGFTAVPGFHGALTSAPKKPNHERPAHEQLPSPRLRF